MKNLKIRLRNLLECTFSIFLVGSIFTTLILLLYSVRYALQPLGFIVTFVLFVSLTLCTFEKKITALLSISGIILYVISWSAVKHYGVIPGQLIWATGLLIWFYSVSKTFNVNLFESPKTA